MDLQARGKIDDEVLYQLLMERGYSQRQAAETAAHLLQHPAPAEHKFDLIAGWFHD